MPSYKKLVIATLSLLIIISDIITFFLADTTQFTSTINQCGFQQCTQSSAKNFFSKISQIFCLAAILFFISALCNLCIFILRVFCFKGEIQPGWKCSRLLMVLGSAGVLGISIYFGYCIKTYIYLESVYSCVEEKEKIQNIFQSVSVLLIICTFLVVAHFLTFLLLLRVRPKKVKKINKMEVAEANFQEIEDKSRSDLTHDQATQVQTSIRQSRRRKIFSMKPKGLSMKKDDKLGCQNNFRYQDSQQILINAQEIILQETFDNNPMEVGVLESNKDERKNTRKSYRLNLIPK